MRQNKCIQNKNITKTIFKHWETLMNDFFQIHSAAMKHLQLKLLHLSSFHYYSLAWEKLLERERSHRGTQRKTRGMLLHKEKPGRDCRERDLGETHRLTIFETLFQESGHWKGTVKLWEGKFDWCGVKAFKSASLINHYKHTECTIQYSNRKLDSMECKGCVWGVCGAWIPGMWNLNLPFKLLANSHNSHEQLWIHHELTGNLTRTTPF